MSTAEKITHYPEQVPIMTEYLREKVVFRGIPIQWEKGEWLFSFQEGEDVKKDTYSIWNPNLHKEIAQRLADGQTCAMYVAGTYGVGKIFEAPDWQDKTNGNREGQEMFEQIKKRPYKDNFVAFIPPQDQIDIIDIDRLSKNYRGLHLATNRENAYAWAQHNIYPARNNGLVDKALLRIDLEGKETPENGSIACFWIPGHWGFEGIVNEVRKIRKHGIFGGGSLNFHGEMPGFVSDDLFQQLLNAEEWRRHIDFIIFDEISEKAQIFRSQSMVSFMRKRPTFLRQGSLTASVVSNATGLDVIEASDMTNASSTTPYSKEANAQVFKNVLWAQDMIKLAKTPLNNLAREDRRAKRFAP